MCPTHVFTWYRKFSDCTKFNLYLFNWAMDQPRSSTCSPAVSNFLDSTKDKYDQKSEAQYISIINSSSLKTLRLFEI